MKNFRNDVKVPVFYPFNYKPVTTHVEDVLFVLTLAPLGSG